MEKNIKEILKASREIIGEEDPNKATELYVKILLSLSNIADKELVEKCLYELIRESA